MSDSKSLEYKNGVRFCFEKSKSNRSSCNKCKENIDKDSIRFGSSTEGNASYIWRHFNCVTDLQKENFNSIYKDYTKVPGFDSLTNKDKNKLISCFGKKDDLLPEEGVTATATISTEVKDANKRKAKDITSDDDSDSDSDSDKEDQIQNHAFFTTKINNNDVVMKTSDDASKRSKKNKDKNAPKRNISGFLFFSASQRQLIKDKHPNYTFSDNATELSIRWKALSEEEKIPFQKLADEDKIRYTNQMEAYKAKLIADAYENGNTSDINERKSSGEPTKKAKKLKDKNAPKSNNSAYLFYCVTQRQQIRDAHPEYGITEAAIELGKRWKALSEEEKIPFQKLADEDKIRFTNEMDAYKLKLANAEVIDHEAKSSGETAKKAKKVKDKNAPKGNLTAYNYFCTVTRQLLKEENPEFVGDMAIELGRRWKAISEQDKIPFQKLSDEDKVRFANEMAAYKSKQLANVNNGEGEDEDGEDN